ncbi:hypothetical protein [Rhodococcus sp. 14-2483-1-2]|uniref:hypothetical protein n=1 Tax=Rhodococcus sp. 14-2483-1-2 TaxID=2023147 RepID=UPI000B9AA20D|nr:hypothetical protein [Rhodococcus sp. 14-2483-1-2]OZF27403.1 hypothetical protein CH295_22945 [Rhodococcus sp. 14-2483-1-2]
MPVDAEEVQELGRVGVAAVKRWLEATTFIELNWNVYEDAGQCIALCLDGSRKKFDLAGSFIGSRRSPVVVESKRYSSPGNQHKYFKEFLATAYSSTVHESELRGSDIKREYLWVTSHPFQISEWPELTTEEKIRSALEEYSDLLDGREIDSKMLRRVSERIWILVWHEKQEDISLTHEELMTVLATLNRKAPTL